MSQELIQNQRNNESISVLKCIASFIVICLHYPFSGIFGEGVLYSMRFSVPFFFMVSGFYSANKDKKWILNKAKKMLYIIIFTELFYGLWDIFQKCVLEGQAFTTWISSVSAFSHPVRVILCGSIFNGTLWYVYAMFWAWILIYLFRNRVPDKVKLILGIVLTLFLIFGRFYWQNHYDIEPYVFIFNNAISFALPLIIFGELLRKNIDRILLKINFSKSFLIVFCGGIIIVIEYIVSKQYMDFHLSTIFITVGLFLMAQNKPKLPQNFVIKFFAAIGEKYSMWIYLSHIFAGRILDLILKDTVIYEYVKIVYPVAIFVISVVISIFITMIIKCFGKKKNGIEKTEVKP